MSQSLKTALRLKLYLLAGLIIAAAVFVVILRLSVWSLPYYQNSFKNWVSTDQYRTDFEELTVDWENGLPQLSVEGFSVTSIADARLIVSIEHAEAKIDWWRTFLSQRPALQELTITGVQSEIPLDLLTFSVSPDDQPQGEPATLLLLKDLMLQHRISLNDAVVTIVDTNSQKRHQLLLNGEFKGSFSGLQTRLSITNKSGDSIDARLQLALDGETTSGSFYADVSQDAFAYWQPLVLAQLPELVSLEAGGEVWGEWRNNRVSQVSADVRLDKLGLQLQEKLLHVDDLLFRVSAQQVDKIWSFIVEPSQGRINGTPIPIDRLTAQLKENELCLNVRTVDLGILNRLIGKIPHIPAEVTEELAILSPSGLLRNLRAMVDLETLENALPEVLLNADVVGVSVEAYDGAPKIDNIQGVLSHDQHGGVITFESTPLFLSFPDLFSKGWGIERAQGTVLWRLSPDSVWVESDLLQIEMPEITAKGRFSLDIPYSKDAASDFSLMIGTQNANGTITPALIPDKEINPDLHQWLSTAILKGKVNEGVFMYHGPLESWAYDPSIQLYFDVSQAQIKYSPDWPEINEVKGLVLVKDIAVLVKASSGKTFTTKLSNGTFYLPEGSDQLKIDASLSGPAADIKQVLLNSPVAKQLGEEFTHWQLQGESTTKLDLSLNLADLDASGYQVSSTLAKGRFFSEPRNLSIDDINGTLVYDHQQGLNGKGIKASFFDNPIFVRIDTEARNQETHTVVRADGQMNIARLNKWLDLELLNLFQGVSPYSAFVDICTSEKRDCSSIRVTSDLEGISTRLLPKPFAKTATEKRPFELRTEIDGDKNWMRIKLESRLNSLLLIDDNGLLGGEVILGRTNQLPQQRSKGLWIKGFLDEINVPEWQEIFNQYGGSAVSDKGTVSIDPMLNTVDLTVADLKLSEDINFRQVNLGFKPAEQGRTLEIKSAKVAGRVFLPSDHALAYTANFQRLYFPQPSDETLDELSESDVAAGNSVDGGRPKAVDPLEDFDPKKLLAMKLKIDDLRRGERQLGEWELVLEPKEDGVSISKISGKNTAMTLSGSAQWIKQQGGQLSRMDLVFQSEEFGDVQKLFDISPVITSKKVNVKANLLWQGSPLGFNSETLGGDVDLDAGKGRFLHAGSASALRLFGILNLNTIGRRLRLDFDDVAKEGLSFDKILGHYRIEHGVATSTEPLKFTGPSADIELIGSVDLSKETINKTMRVTLPLSDSLPLTALLLGTPQVAGVMFLFDKLTGSKLSKITTTVYEVKGPWEDPKIEPAKSKSAESKPKSQDQTTSSNL